MGADLADVGNEVEGHRVDVQVLVVEVGHSMMRYDSEVAEQTIEFIKNGKFKEKVPSEE